MYQMDIRVGDMSIIHQASGIALTLALSLFSCALAHADLPSPVSGQPAIEQTRASDLVLTDKERRSLESRLAQSVVVIKAEQPQNHQLAMNGIRFDGAGVAVSASSVSEVLALESTENLDVRKDVEENANSLRSSTFFDETHRRVSSPFAARSAPTREIVSTRQYYLTTADWLTGAAKVGIEIKGRVYAAQMEYRDDAQNVAILSTSPISGVKSASIYDFDAHGKTLPGVIYLLLNPGSSYQSMTQHTLSLGAFHEYATTNHTARNGYPIFSKEGEIVGLTVGPVPTHTQAYVVHAGLLDRALHPRKYDRTTIEEIELSPLKE